MYYLCRLYKSLGDYDVLHGVFSRQIGTKPITREALEAEERRDYFEALRLYKEVSGKGGHLTLCTHEFKFYYQHPIPIEWLYIHQISISYAAVYD